MSHVQYDESVYKKTPHKQTNKNKCDETNKTKSLQSCLWMKNIEFLPFPCGIVRFGYYVFQQAMLDYFLSTREEVFFMAVRDRMALSTNSIKEK